MRSGHCMVAVPWLCCPNTSGWLLSYPEKTVLLLSRPEVWYKQVL